MLADLRPTALLALTAPTTVLTDLRPTALLAYTALTTVRTSAAHLAHRTIFLPVLARSLHARASLRAPVGLNRIVLDAQTFQRPHSRPRIIVYVVQ